MKKIFLLTFFTLFSLPVFSQEKGLDQRIDEAFKPVSDFFSEVIFFSIGENPFVIYLLVGSALFFTLYFVFPNIRYFLTSINVVRGKYDEVEKDENSSKEGEVSHFQALTTAVSGTVGNGNIAGVALAIALGGPGATFWMIVCGLMGMSLKFVECTLGVHYRDVDENGVVYGGPMYYLSKGLKEKGFATLGKISAIFFAIFCIGGSFGGGNAAQANQAAIVLKDLLGFESTFSGAVIGIVLAIVVGIIIIGGIKRIASVASRIIPIMGLIYFGGALIILAENYQNIIPSFNAIFAQVFTGSAAVGGFLGASFAMSLKYGVARGLYSNEAGQGSSPIAHASSKNKSIDQGVVSILEPFIDTIVVCSVTALVILSSGVWTQKFDTTFSKTDMIILEGIYSDKKNVDGEYIYPDHINDLTKYVQSIDSNVNEFSGSLDIKDGKILSENITVIHSRSIAEDITISNSIEDTLFSGKLDVKNGKISEQVSINGKSLVSSAELTAKAFSQGILGQYGGKLVAIALLLFAFSTSITWCYYGDRSTAYIFGEKGVVWYRNFYVLCFVLAAVIDTTVVWNIAYVVVALVSIPNLIAMFVLRKEMKSLSDNFDIK